MKLAELERHLRQHGCALYREGAAHSIWFNPALHTQRGLAVEGWPLALPKCSTPIDMDMTPYGLPIILGRSHARECE